jgi:hypothetical protein
MDVLFGVAIASPLLIFGRFTPGVALLAGGFLLHAVLLNGVAGNLKDFDSDALSGLKTTSVVLGVKRSRDGVLLFPVLYRAYVLAYETAGTGAYLAVCAIRLHGGGGSTCFVLLVALSGFAINDLLAMFGRRRAESRDGREVFILANLAQFMIAAATVTSVWMASLGVALVVSWTMASLPIITTKDQSSNGT